MLNVLLDADIAEKICEKLKNDSLVSFQNGIEFVSFLNENNYPLDLYLNSYTTRHKREIFIEKLSSCFTSPLYKEFFEIVYSQRNENLCEMIFDKVLKIENSLDINEQLNKVKFFIDLEKKYNVFTKEVKNSFVVLDEQIVNLLKSTGFYSFSAEHLNEVVTPDDLFPKMDMMLNIISEGGELPENALALIPLVQSKFKKTLKNTTLIDYFYKKVSDVYGDKTLLSYNLNKKIGFDDIEDYVNECENLGENRLDKKLSFDDVVVMNFSSKIKKTSPTENLEANLIATLSPNIAIDYLKLMENELKNNKADKDKIFGFLNDWLSVYAVNVAYDNEFEHLKPIRKIIDVAKEYHFKLDISACTRLVNIFGTNNKDVNQISYEFLSNSLRTSKVLPDGNLLINDLVGITKMYNSAFNSGLMKDEKEDFLNLFGYSLSQTGQNLRFNLLKNLLTVDEVLLKDVMNSSYCGNQILSVNHSDDDARKDDIISNLNHVFNLLIRDEIEMHNYSSNDYCFDKSEREKLVAIAFNSDSILKSLPTQKIGNKLFFKQMLGNSKYSDIIIKGISNQIDNPIVRDYMNNKNFKLVFSQSPNELAQIILIKMKLDDKFNNQKENKTNVNDDADPIGFKI